MMAIPENPNVIRFILTYVSLYTSANPQAAFKSEGIFVFSFILKKILRQLQLFHCYFSIIE